MDRNAVEIERAILAGFVEDGTLDTFRDARTFEDSGVLTNDRGLVVEIEDGSEYQITIVRSG